MWTELASVIAFTRRPWSDSRIKYLSVNLCWVSFTRCVLLIFRLCTDECKLTSFLDHRLVLVGYAVGV